MADQHISEKLPSWIRDHVQRYIESDGADGHYWDSSLAGGEGMATTLLLTTVGRKSGLTLTLPLLYIPVDDGYCVAASKGGAPRNPAWFLNLEAEPNVQLQVAADKFQAVARVTLGDEREALWQQMVDGFPPYEKYQKLTDRRIPVVLFERL